MRNQELTDQAMTEEEREQALVDLRALHGTDVINAMMAEVEAHRADFMLAPRCLGPVAPYCDDTPDQPAEGQPEDAVDVADYDHSIHCNPDADAWARFYCAHYPTADLDLMRGWFANAMMAMHDFLLTKQRQEREAEWALLTAGAPPAEALRADARALAAVLIDMAAVEEDYGAKDSEDLASPAAAE